jgi:hypothetical protein
LTVNETYSHAPVAPLASTLMSSSRLPAETVDTIIDHLHADKQSLLACGLTCKQWLPSSRCHLFSDIILNQQRVGSFLEILESASTDIALMVRRLVLHDFAEMDWRGGEPIELSAMYKRMQHVFTLLHRVKQLRLSKSYSRVVTAGMVSALNSVRELEMVNMRFAEEEHAFEFIYAFPLLQSLSIVESNWTYSPSRSSRYNTVRPGQPSFSLRSLSLGMDALSGIAQWLLGLDPLPAIHALGLDAYEFVETPQNVVALLHSVSSSIRKLEIKFWTYYPDDWADSMC